MGLQGHLKKPTVIDDYMKKESLNIQLENLRPQRNIENNDK